MRYDFKVKFSDHIIEDNIGQLICMDAILARDGEYIYSSDEVFGDGSYNAITLHRDWEDVKKLKGTLEGKPVIYFHTDRGVDIDMNNIDEFKVGHLQNVRESKAEGYNVLVGDLFITDKDIIEKIKNGSLREISLGYFYTLDESNPSRLRQTEMVAEHIALVDSGRAGISKILDSDGYYYLINYTRRSNPQYAVYLNADSGNEDPGWISVKGYGYIKFYKYYGDLSTASLIPEKVINMLISQEKITGAVINSRGEIVRSYLFGRRTDPNYLQDNGYDVSGIGNEPVTTNDDYMIPDEQAGIVEDDNLKREPTKDELFQTVQRELSHIWGDVLKDRDKGFYGRYYDKAHSIIKSNKHILEEIFTFKIPEDKYDYDMLHIMRTIVNYGGNKDMNKKKVGDESYFPMIVVKYDAEKVDIEWAADLKEAARLTKVKLNTEISVDEMIAEMNTNEGLFALAVPLTEDIIAMVATAVADDNVMIDVYETIEELNSDQNDYFDSFDEAYATINTKMGRYKNKAIIVI